MGIYNAHTRYLVEADDDENNASNAGGADQPVDTNDNAETNNDNAETNNDNTENAEDNTNGDENTEENNEEDNGDDDYDINAGDDTNDNEDENGGEDTNTEDANTGGDAEENNDDETEGEIEHPELDKVYDRLTPQEKMLHDHELRQNYRKLYNSLDVIIEKTVALPRTSETLQITTNLLHTLFSFKKYILYYIEHWYENKTLVENSIEFYKYMSIMSAYRSVYKSLEKEMVREND